MTWEFASRILQVTDVSAVDMLPMLAGTLSEGIGREFLGFCKIYSDLPTIEQITKAPESTKVPVEPSILFALTGSISHNATKDNFNELMLYILRLPIEFQVVCLRETVRRNKTMTAHPAVQKWIVSNAANLF